MNEGDKVYIRHIDIDGCGGDGDIITEGVVVRGEMNGTIRVQYKDDYCFMTTEREFYPHELELCEG